MINRNRYTIDDIKNNRFYQMPKFLFEEELKKELNNDAKVLYSLLKDRHELSIKNNWINDKGEVYFIYTRKEMEEMLGVSQPTLRKAIKQLINHGLMQEEQIGLNKANRIYLTVVARDSYMINRNRYTIDDIKNNRFYQMPKFLFEEELKEGLNNDAKVLYSLLKDRHELSIKNNWINDKGEVYLIYTRKEMEEMLGISQPTLRKAIKQLINHGLMQEEQIGLNKANRIYLTVVAVETSGVKDSFSPECKDLSLQSVKNFHSRMKENFGQECKEFSPNNTNINNTDIISINQSKEESCSNVFKTKTDRLIDINKFLLNNNFKSYEELVSFVGIGKEYFDYPYTEYISAVKKAIFEMFNYETTKVNGVLLKQSEIIAKLQNLNNAIIVNAIDNIIYTSHNVDIVHPIAFLKTVILNEIDAFDIKIQNQINFNKDPLPHEDKKSYNKTRFHNFKQRTDNYSEEEIEEIVKKKRETFLKRLKQL